MKWKCFFSHDYRMESARNCELYENESEKIPTDIYKLVLMRCKTCGNIKSKKITGLWADHLKKMKEDLHEKD